MGILITLLILYGLYFASLYVHEIFHHPKKIRILRYFPPMLAAMGAKYRYTALAFNSAVFLIVYFIDPTNFWLRALGLINFIYVNFYLIFGSFNYEPDMSKIKKSIRKYIVLDDLENKYWPIFIGLSIFFIIKFSPYYLKILKEVIQKLI